MVITKNMVAYFALVLFALALSHSEIKYQLLGTNWGRALTLILVVAATKFNKWIGIVAAIIIVFFFAVWDEDIMEGFKKKKGKSSSKSKSKKPTKAEINGKQTYIRKLKYSAAQAFAKKEKAGIDKKTKDIWTSEYNMLTKSIDKNQKELDDMIKRAEGFTLFGMSLLEGVENMCPPPAATTGSSSAPSSNVPAGAVAIPSGPPPVASTAPIKSVVPIASPKTIADKPATEGDIIDLAIIEGTRDAQNTIMDLWERKPYVDNMKDGELKDYAKMELTINQRRLGMLQNYVNNLGKEAERMRTTGAEGFDLIGTESSIRRGKQSNNVEVAPFMRTSSMVEPFDNAMFKNGQADF